ncbi:MAG: glycoside hydrolase family 9 protein, partial [Myxococcales bacterium]
MTHCLRHVRSRTGFRTIRRLAPGAAVLSASLICVSSAVAADEDIRLATVGYAPERAKVATVVGAVGTAFVVKSSPDGATTLKGNLSESVVDPDSKEEVRFADFSSLEKPGRYFLEVEGLGRSLEFPIGPDVYREQLKTVMLGFYGWRSGPAVQFTHRDQVFKQGPGHLHDGLLDYLGQSGVNRDGSHGWYDAGDYGKYTVNGAFALGMMLKAWEMFPTALSALELPIPERGGSFPDFLDELKWEFDWLQTMQYSDTDGRVSHKLTSLEFAEFIMPEADVAPTYYSPYGTAAAADFVAAMAMGARVFRRYDSGLADRMLGAAKVTDAWLAANAADIAPDIKDFKTGAYTTTDTDDRLWAAAEMWETTGDASALS